MFMSGNRDKIMNLPFVPATGQIFVDFSGTNFVVVMHGRRLRKNFSCVKVHHSQAFNASCSTQGNSNLARLEDFFTVNLHP